MKKTFCTVSTFNYMPYVLTLNESLLNFDKDIVLNVLISDIYFDASEYQEIYKNIRFFTVTELCSGGIGRKIFEKYHKTNMDCFRWSMKSVFLQYLLEVTNYDKVICVDNDIHFFNDYQFLFEELNKNSVLLSPHFRSSNPHIDEANFITLFNSGLFNGGFVGVNKNGVSAMRWWSEACEFICEINPCKGQFVDQTHLNLLPIYFDNVKIIKHRGCNVANWNLIECKRIQTNNTVLINGKYPIVFMHFTKSTINGILNGSDSLLSEHLAKHKEGLQNYGVNLKLNIQSKPKEKIVSKQKKKLFLQKIKSKIRLRTRIKAFING